jgi:AcrR family transcriptional regulator
MSPRVSAKHRDQHQQERRGSILDAAIEVFDEKGFDRANVEAIARAAGIGKGTVYLYFKSKEDIFAAIVAERTLLPKMTQLMAVADVSLEAGLTQIAENYLQFVSECQSVVRLVLTDSQRFPAHAEQVYTGVILKGNKLLANFLTEQAKAGKIRKLDDPLITARAFIGMLMTYTLTQEMLGGKRFTPIKPKTWVKEVVRLFLDGVRA